LLLVFLLLLLECLIGLLYTSLRRLQLLLKLTLEVFSLIQLILKIIDLRIGFLKSLLLGVCCGTAAITKSLKFSQIACLLTFEVLDTCISLF